MRKTSEKLKKFSKALIAFFVIALVFLAVGLATLGSPRDGVGKAFELKAPRNGNSSGVIINLTLSDSTNFKETYLDEDGKEQTRTYELKLTDVYVNLAVIYAKPDETATLRLEYAQNGNESSFGLQSRRADAVFENLSSAKAEEGAASTVKDGLFHWVSPFHDTIEQNKWSRTYYVRLTSLTHDLLVNEVVFVGEKVVNSEATGEYMLIPAKIYKATPNANETMEEANLRAGALLDAQYMPSSVQSSYYRYSADELYTLSTIAEMRRGGEYDTTLSSEAYRVEGVYNSLGTDIVALGTEIFGLTPFGLRFMSMLASFGVLVFGFLFVRQLTKSNFAGLVFSLIYVFCNLTFALGHLGNPLMIGLFFFMGALYFCHKFYARGMKSARGAGVFSPILSALFAAAAIAVNGAYLIPVAGLAALFACGMIRQQKAKKHYLALAASAENEEEREQATAAVEREYREKNLAALLGFVVTLVVAAMMFALLFAIPLYNPYLRLYSAGKEASIFTLAWHAFAGGFVGSNPGAMHSAWDLFYQLFTGTGATYAVTAVAVNAVAAVAGICGILFAVWRIIAVIRAKKLEKEQRSELRRVLVPLAGLIVSLIMTAFGGGALGFLMLAYVFAFVLAAEAIAFLWESKYQKAARIVSIVGLVLLIAVFALYAVVTFSIPLPASLMGKIFG